MQCWTPFYNLCYFKCFWSICMQDIISVLSILSTRPNFFVSLSYCLNTPFTLSLQFLHTTFPLSANAYALYSISSWVNMLTLLMLLPYFKEFIGLCISLYWSSKIGLIRGRKICSTICVLTLSRVPRYLRLLFPTFSGKRNLKYLGTLERVTTICLKIKFYSNPKKVENHINVNSLMR